MKSKTRVFATAAAIATCPSLAGAQQSTFQTPGMPIWSASGQIDRFTNTFNPAIGAVLDGFADYVDAGDDARGFDIALRSFEMTVNGRVDPNWSAYAVVVYADEEVELEEAAVTYGGFESTTTLRFGRFFVDFGKQMQAHVHDLPYPERPGVLTEFLGEELPGVGVQVDHWWPTGDTSALRASAGVFGEFEFSGGDLEVTTDERQSLDALGVTARLTQFMDVGQRGVFQWGASGWYVPEFGLLDEASETEVDGLSRATIGLDMTYGFDSEDGLSGWTFGAEGLLATGDLSGEHDADESALSVLDGERQGLYVWGEQRVDAQNAFGLLYSTFEHLEASPIREDQVTAYYTRFLSEFVRVRVAASYSAIEQSEDASRILIQLTTFFGPHAHGVNW